MGDVTVGKTCPGCYGTNVLKNGTGRGPQQWRCMSEECGIQFGEGKAFGRRFPDEVIATGIGLHLFGRSYRKCAADLERHFSISDTKISGRTVQGWVEKHVDLAVEKVRELPVITAGPWRVEYASLRPADGGCWVVRDSPSSYVLAAQAGDSFDPAVAAALIPIFEESIGKLSDNLHLLTLATDEPFENPKAIKQMFPFGDYIPAKDIPLVHRSDGEMPSRDSIFEFPGDFRYPLQIMRRRGAFRSPESRQRFLDGWVVMLNFFIERDGPGGYTPARGAGVEAPFRSWLDVVNHPPRKLYLEKARSEDEG